MKKPVATLNLCPTWESLVPYFLIVFDSGTDAGKKIAREEILRMAKVADLYVKSKEAKP